MDYWPRTVDAELTALRDELPAVSIDGAKGVGKTATARQQAPEIVFELDDAVQRQLLEADRTALDPHGKTTLIDEWQRLPEVWDTIRRAVDDGAPAGRFLLTGSAAPRNVSTHSGAGRIVSVRMRPMSLAERVITTPTVSLADLLGGDRTDVGGRTDLTLTDYVEEIVGSGFPGIRGRSGRAIRAQLDGYLTRIVERDFPEQGLTVRKPETLLGWMRAYAAATATEASYHSILTTATPGEGAKPAKTTTIKYRDVLAQLWMLDPVPAFTTTGNQFRRLAAAPKHHLADPALAARLLDLDVDDLRGRTGFGNPGPVMLGPLFESLVTLSVRSYAQAAGMRISHLRTPDGHREVDLIVEGRAGAILALEVKLSASVDDGDVRDLHWLRERLGDRLLDAAVITTGPVAYRRADGIAVIPAGLFGP